MSEKKEPAKKVEAVGGDKGAEPNVAHKDKYSAIGGSYTLDPVTKVRKRVEGQDIQAVVEDGFEEVGGEKIPKFKQVSVKELPSNNEENK